MNSRVLVCCWMLSFLNVGFSQWERQTTKEVEELTSAMTKIYRSENYRIDFEKKIFLSEGDTAYQSEKGQLLKGPGLDYSVASKEMTLIQEKGLKVVYYPKNNTVYLMNPDSTMQIIDLESIQGKMQHYDYFLKTEGAMTVLKAVNKYPSEILSTEMYLDGERLTKLRMYFAPGNYVQTSMSDESEEQPYMEITYSAPQRLTPQDKLLLTTEKYVYVENGAYHLRRNPGENYQLIDLRVPQSKTTNR